MHTYLRVSGMFKVVRTSPVIGEDLTVRRILLNITWSQSGRPLQQYTTINKKYKYHKLTNIIFKFFTTVAGKGSGPPARTYGVRARWTTDMSETGTDGTCCPVFFCSNFKFIPFLNKYGVTWRDKCPRSKEVLFWFFGWFNLFIIYEFPMRYIWFSCLFVPNLG